MLAKTYWPCGSSNRVWVCLAQRDAEQTAMFSVTVLSPVGNVGSAFRER